MNLSKIMEEKIMNENINLFLENNAAIEKTRGAWGIENVQKKCSALTVTLKNKKIDVDRINSAVHIIKENTSVFSSFRSTNKLSTSVAISMEEDMESSLNKIISIYDKLKDEFFSNEYLAITSQIIFNSRYRINIDDAVKKTKSVYNHMKKNHRFLTGSEDTASAAIIAVTSSNFEETFNDIEECYKILKGKHISSRNNIQTLSHILSLINMPPKDKCEKVIEMYSALKKKKVPVDDYYLPMLGIISFVTHNVKGFAEKVWEVSNELKSHKGFGALSLQSKLRNMIAAALVSMDYLDDLDSDLKDILIGSTNTIALTTIAAMDIAMTAAIITAYSVGASSANSSS